MGALRRLACRSRRKGRERSIRATRSLRALASTARFRTKHARTQTNTQNERTISSHCSSPWRRALVLSGIVGYGLAMLWCPRVRLRHKVIQYFGVPSEHHSLMSLREPWRISNASALWAGGRNGQTACRSFVRSYAVQCSAVLPRLAWAHSLVSCEHCGPPLYTLRQWCGIAEGLRQLRTAVTERALPGTPYRRSSEADYI